MSLIMNSILSTVTVHSQSQSRKVNVVRVESCLLYVVVAPCCRLIASWLAACNQHNGTNLSRNDEKSKGLLLLSSGKYLDT